MAAEESTEAGFRAVRAATAALFALPAEQRSAPDVKLELATYWHCRVERASLLSLLPSVKIGLITWGILSSMSRFLPERPPSSMRWASIIAARRIPIAVATGLLTWAQAVADKESAAATTCTICSMASSTRVGGAMRAAYRSVAGHDDDVLRCTEAVSRSEAGKPLPEPALTVAARSAALASSLAAIRTGAAAATKAVPLVVRRSRGSPVVAPEGTSETPSDDDNDGDADSFAESDAAVAVVNPSTKSTSAKDRFSARAANASRPRDAPRTDELDTAWSDDGFAEEGFFDEVPRSEDHLTVTQQQPSWETRRQQRLEGHESRASDRDIRARAAPTSRVAPRRNDLQADARARERDSWPAASNSQRGRGGPRESQLGHSKGSDRLESFGDDEVDGSFIIYDDATDALQ